MDYAGNGRPRRLMAGVCSTAPKTIAPGLRQQLQALSMLHSPCRPRTTGDDSSSPHRCVVPSSTGAHWLTTPPTQLPSPTYCFPT